MKKKWFIILISILSLLIIYEIFNNKVSLSLISIGLIIILLRNHLPINNQYMFLFIGIFSLIVALLLSRIVFILFIIFILIFIGNNPNIFQFIHRNIMNSDKDKPKSEFIMVDFEKIQNEEVLVSKSPWIYNDNQTEDNIYRWEDMNYSVFVGNTVFDLGNTILPKEKNIIIIRKAFGKTKIIIPEGVAIFLDINLLLGEIVIDDKKITLKNENFKWHSKDYNTASRKIKLLSNHLFGEIEVVFI